MRPAFTRTAVLAVCAFALSGPISAEDSGGTVVKLPQDIVFKGGLHVYTSLSPTMQLKAEHALRDGLRALESRRAAVAAVCRG